MIRYSSLLALAGCLAAAGAAHATECSPAAISALKVHGVTVVSADAKSGDDKGPAACMVGGTVTTAGEGAPDGSARFAVTLPVQWNGKFVFWGVGGLAGNLFPSVTRADIVTATAKGYATAITDTGHEAPGTDASWSLKSPGVADDARLADYYFRAIHDVTLAAKQLVQGYFGKPLAKSYFDGCSNGGRQGLVEASRYPEDYDGIVAGAPFMDLKAILSGTRIYQHLFAKPAAYIPAALLPVIDRAVLAACDAADGVKDGLIQNPAQCAFDTKTLICKPGETKNCLSADQAETLETYVTATRDEAGHVLFPGSATTDLHGGGMDVWTVGLTSPDEAGAAEPWSRLGQAPLSWQFSDNVQKYFVARDPAFDLRKFRFDAASVDLFRQRTAAANGDDPTRLAPFIAKGNKLLIYHGFSDPALTPYRTVKFYEDLAAAQGGYDAVQHNVRLFMAPNMQHCGGGSGPNVFDTLSALEDWVEQGKAPDAIQARHFTGNDWKQPADRTMPLCPFPAAAVYKGQGDVNDAANWSCSPNRKMLEVGKGGAEAGLTAQK
jgi:feruloyl esterase